MEPIILSMYEKIVSHMDSAFPKALLFLKEQLTCWIVHASGPYFPKESSQDLSWSPQVTTSHQFGQTQSCHCFLYVINITALTEGGFTSMRREGKL